MKFFGLFVCGQSNQNAFYQLNHLQPTQLMVRNVIIKATTENDIAVSF